MINMLYLINLNKKTRQEDCQALLFERIGFAYCFILPKKAKRADAKIVKSVFYRFHLILMTMT
jgi:hypothetical protein